MFFFSFNSWHLILFCIDKMICLLFHCDHYLQVYQLSIGAACGLSWPSDRITIQVLDDSTDPTIKVANSHAWTINNPCVCVCVSFFGLIKLN